MRQLGVQDIRRGQRREEAGDLVLVDLDLHHAVLRPGGQPALGRVAEQVARARARRAGGSGWRPPRPPARRAGPPRRSCPDRGTGRGRRSGRPRPCCARCRGSKRPSWSRCSQTNSRTSWAMSGSSEAVGSSRRATRGRARNALASITRVVWPAESPAMILRRRSQTPNRVEQLPAAGLAIGSAQAVEPAEDVEVLLDRQVGGQLGVGAGEADLGEDRLAGGLERLAEVLDAAGGRP